MRRIWMLLPALALSACLIDDKSDDDDDDEDEDEDSGAYADTDTGPGGDDDDDPDPDTDPGGDDDDEGTDPDTDTDTDTDPDTDPGGGGDLDVDAVYFQYEATLNDGDIVTASYEGTDIEGFAYIWFVDSGSWTGTEDTDNGCLIAFALSAGTGSSSSALSGSGYYFGWEPDLDSALVGYSDSCAEVGNLRGAPVDIVADYDWGFGFGPLGSDLGDALEDAYGADWAQYEGSAFGGYVSIDGDVAELSYGLVFETTSSNELIADSDGTLEFADISSAGSSGDGYFRAFPAYGLDAGAL